MRITILCPDILAQDFNIAEDILARVSDTFSSEQALNDSVFESTGIEHPLKDFTLTKKYPLRTQMTNGSWFDWSTQVTIKFEVEGHEPI